MTPSCEKYASTIRDLLSNFDWEPVERLTTAVKDCWSRGGQLFLCGNGGSAGNAIHLANDFLCGVDNKQGGGIRVTALPANVSLITCLANDVGYEHVFSIQLKTLAQPGDVLIVFSGSGNSPNIIEVLKAASAKGVTSAAVLGYSGGKARELADISIHFAIDDMQIAEDMQLIVGHMMMQQLCRERKNQSS